MRARNQSSRGRQRYIRHAAPAHRERANLRGHASTRHCTLRRLTAARHAGHNLLCQRPATRLQPHARHSHQHGGRPAEWTANAASTPQDPTQLMAATASRVNRKLSRHTHHATILKEHAQCGSDARGQQAASMTVWGRGGDTLSAIKSSCGLRYGQAGDARDTHTDAHMSHTRMHTHDTHLCARGGVGT